VNSLERVFRRTDPYYRVPLVRRSHGGWLRAQKDRAYILGGLRTQDHRPPQQREAAEFGPFHRFICAARAENQHVRHVAKAQATMRWRKAQE
jgi:hypothetical protein